MWLRETSRSSPHLPPPGVCRLLDFHVLGFLSLCNLATVTERPGTSGRRVISRVGHQVGEMSWLRLYGFSQTFTNWKDTRALICSIEIK